MHTSALKHAKRFFDSYAGNLRSATVLDIGAQDVNGSLKDVCPAQLKYIGVDFVPGKGVDVILEDPYLLPFGDQSADIIVSNSCFEHSEMFWLLFLEIMRVLKPAGLFYLNAPSNGRFHRYPVDCWRFYPDSGRALVTWARRNKYDPLLLESFIGRQQGEGAWNDFVAVFLRDRSHAAKYPTRMLDSMKEFMNGCTAESNQFLNPSELSEDLLRLKEIHRLSALAVKVK